MAAGGQTAPTPSCPVDSLPPLGHRCYLEKPAGERSAFSFCYSQKSIKLCGPRVRSDLGPGPGISDQLLVGVPLSAILAELEVETRHKGAKHTTPLSQHPYRKAERKKKVYLLS